MASPLCFFKNPISQIAVLAPLLIFATSLGFGFLAILLASAVLVLSTFLHRFSKQNQGLIVKKSITQEVLISFDQDHSPYIEDVVSKNHSQNQREAIITQEKDAQEEGLDSFSESECLDHLTTSEESEVDLLFHDNLDRTPDISDGSISDEESLIEIALPCGHYLGHKEEPINIQQKVSDFTSQPIFKKQALVELLAEINDMNIEEDNLIEIDISMGSIKCTRFEIEA
ncbi:hypothetical protein CFOL_v3_22658 [Cephalotus follicularis]|uniref:Uncharacterized protein n=1 Tax=Cephalotus follicularis TaxID=3775 RepID=A0A1Q3CGJ0_CEPFO|nr:hypothetical protein CFOL_v3_22658 [Cephalotus follicularis]